MRKWIADALMVWGIITIVIQAGMLWYLIESIIQN